MDTQNSGGQQQQVSWLLPNLVYSTLMKMQEAKSTTNRWAYWVHWSFAVSYMIPHMKAQHRKKLQNDYNELQKIILEIKQTPEDVLNASARNEKVLEAQFLYADNREYYIFNSLPNIGMGADQQEGVVDFETMNIDDIAKIVRSRHGDRLDEAADMKAKRAEENGN